MDSGQHAVCVALNDNDRAWYEMLVPFVLSLRQTDYRGHIVVIGYGLSQRKIEILQAQSIDVVAAEEPPLSYGRYLEVSRLCERNPGLTKVALYDADIWFCSGEFDLFQRVEGDDIHVCRDAYLCDFVTDPLIGPARDTNLALVADAVLRRYGSALQAGLIAGTAQAWRDFAGHVRACVGRIGQDFRACYGLDTTFLHLWGAEGRVELLPATQNFVVKDGVIERRSPGNPAQLLSHLGPIRGLHMTTDIRFMPCWRYYGIHREHALEAGRAFALAPAEEAQAHAIPEGFAHLVGALGLEIAALSGEGTASFNAFRTPENLTIVGQGEHTITLRSVRPQQPLIIAAMSFTGAPAPLRARICVDGHEVVFGHDLSQWAAVTVAAGMEVRLLAESLPGQMATIVWTLAGEHTLGQ